MCMFPGNRQNSNGQTPSFHPGAIKKMVLEDMHMQLHVNLQLDISDHIRNELTSCTLPLLRKWILAHSENILFDERNPGGFVFVPSKNMLMHMQTGSVHVSTFCHFKFSLGNLPTIDTTISRWPAHWSLPTYHTPAFRVYWPICSQGFRRFWAWSRCATWYATSG